MLRILQISDFLFKEFLRGVPIEDFAGHGVDARRYCVTLFLCDLRKTFALGEVKDIPKWVEAYRFTHPTAESITVKIWLKDEEQQAL